MPPNHIILPNKVSQTNLLPVITAINTLEETNDPTPSCTLDFSRVEFIEPAALVIIAALTHYNFNIGRSITIICPDSTDCLKYLWCTNFLKYIHPAAKVEGDKDLCSTNYDSNATTLLPLTQIANSNDIQDTYASVRERLNSMLSETDKSPRGMLPAFLSTIQEICQNILTHANTAYGWIAAQQYHSQQSDCKFVKLAISDCGSGICKTLLSKHAGLRPLPDSHIIKVMLQQGLSRFSAGGTGYFTVRNAAKSHKGSWMILSGHGRVWQYKSHPSLRTGQLQALCPGTHLVVTLTCA